MVVPTRRLWFLRTVPMPPVPHPHYLVTSSKRSLPPMLRQVRYTGRWHRLCVSDRDGPSLLCSPRRLGSPPRRCVYEQLSLARGLRVFHLAECAATVSS